MDKIFRTLGVVRCVVCEFKDKHVDNQQMVKSFACSPAVDHALRKELNRLQSRPSTPAGRNAISYWDGAVLPMGLGLSLVINGLFIARHINKVNTALRVLSRVGSCAKCPAPRLPCVARLRC